LKPTFSYQDKLHIRAEKLIENPHIIIQEFTQRKSKPLRIGGMDLAKRVDHSALSVGVYLIIGSTIFTMYSKDT